MSDDYDWDALAAHWELFEQAGSGDEDIDVIADAGAAAPALVVGAGIGTYAARLAARIGGPVTAVDRSAAMLARAAERHPELRLGRADARALPFNGASFATVYCATGVAEMLLDLAGALREFVRVASGPVFLSVIPPPQVRIDRHALVARALAGEIHDPLVAALAARAGSMAAAAALLLRAMPRFAVGVPERAVIDAGLATGRSIRRLYRSSAHDSVLWQLV